MRSAFRVTTPVTLQVPTPSHPFSPYSPFAYIPFRKRTTFGVAAVDASHSPAGQALPPSVALCHCVDAETLTHDTQRDHLTRPLPACNFDNDTENNGTANPNTSPEPLAGHSSFAPTGYTSCFPVYGPFELLYCIQNGGLAATWAARDQSTGRLLCLKAFQSVWNPDVKRSVRTELKTFRRTVKAKGGERGKQFIMELSRSIQHDTTVYFAMELMTHDLGTYLFTEPDRCKLHARRWMAQLALGIESMHEMAILHRDIKVENILIDSRENVRIIDFGLSYMDPTGEPLCQGVGYAVEFLGTPPYMAPEVLRNERMPPHRKKRYGTAVDWWALGCVLFELESRDHQLLFDTEEDVHAYVGWTQRPDDLEETYFRFDGLDPVVVDLVSGLLHVHPSLRFELSDLEEHDYFLLHDGSSEFDNAGARALERPICPELVPQFTRHDGPNQVIAAARSRVIYDWTNLKWGHLGKER